MSRFLLASILAIPFLSLPACRKRPGLPPSIPARPFALRRGEQLYRKWCAACHGPEGRGDGLGWNRDLRPRPADLAARKGLTPEELERIFSSPREGSCPSWKKNFTPAGTACLAAWIRRLSAPGERGARAATEPGEKGKEKER